jgi:hypothetical protein
VMLHALGGPDSALATGEFVVLHRQDGRVLATDRHRP